MLVRIQLVLLGRMGHGHGGCWRLLTPPGTPLFSSLKVEPKRSLVSQAGTPKARPTALKSRQLDVVMEEGQGEELEVMLSESDDSEFDHDDEFPPSTDGDELSKTEKTKRGGKRSRAGIQLSPSKCKANRVKRAGCWKYFKVVTVASRKELGVMETKAKCKFCHRSYLYHQGGITTTLNRHLDKCTQYLNKLAQAKKNLAQGRR